MKARLGVLLLLLSVLTGALLTTNLSAASATGFTARLTQSRPFVGERIQVKGVIAPRGRPIQLQRYRAGRWVRVLSSHTIAGGRYALPVKATSTRTRYRALAPAAKIGGHRYPARGSSSVTVTGVKASGVLGFVPADVAPGSTSTQGLTVGAVTFSPARPGAPVTAQRLSGSTWTTVATGKQSSAGAFAFSVGASAASSTFRAFTRAPGITVTAPSVRPTAWALKFDEPFSGTTLNPNTWSSRQVGESFGHRSCAAVEPGQTTVANGMARLSVAKDTQRLVTPTSGASCSHGTFLNAMVGTNPADFSAGGGRQFTYGMFAARVKFQPGAGQHGAFWLQSVAQGGAEVDAAEYFGAGHADGGLNSYIHYTTSSGALISQGGAQPTSKTILGSGNTPASGWHVYSVQWSPTEYVVRIDGVVTFHTTTNVSHQPAFPIVSLLTSDFELPRLDPAKLPSSMYVDWVRVWQQ